ncbi:hypothetical protein [Pleionea sediminis]|uniref:hypothetical protein n=1 Tax=Pleionea sediminis TaxID=2569479 RepID=UPI001186FC3F|nr:hypothetical protein [Pleionea sediminis]
MSDYISWENLLEDDEESVSPQSSTVAKTYQEKINVDELPVSDEFQKLLKKQKKLENKLKSLAGESTDKTPEQLRQEAMFKVQSVTKDSLREDKRIKKLKEAKNKLLKKSQLKKAIEKARDEKEQELKRKFLQNKAIKRRLDEANSLVSRGRNGFRKIKKSADDFSKARDLVRDIAQSEKKHRLMLLEQAALEKLPPNLARTYKGGKAKLEQLQAIRMKQQRLMSEIKKMQDEMDADFDMPTATSDDTSELESLRNMALAQRSLQQRLSAAMAENKQEEKRQDLQKALILKNKLNEAKELAQQFGRRKKRKRDDDSTSRFDEKRDGSRTDRFAKRDSKRFQ